MSTTTTPSTSPQYDQTQMIYSFTFSVSPAYGHEFDNVADMQNYVTAIAGQVLSPQNPTIPGLIGTDWEQVWGPVVYAKVTSGKTVVADNTMGCYHSASQKLLVIAIAGTNVISEFDWLDEDLSVHTLVPWQTASPGAPSGSGNISNATYTGLQTLLGMTDSSNLTLLQAIESNIASGKIAGATVAVTGHSLAGALSPCLALYMVENRSLWGGSDAASYPVGAYPTAGPTPGDSAFATYYESVIAAKNITYSSVYNTLDVVPLAWDSNDLATIPSIYDANIVPAQTDSPKDTFMGIVACGLWVDAAPGEFPSNTYTHITTGRTPLKGTWNTVADNSVAKVQYLQYLLPSGLKTYGPYVYALARFVAQAVAQHTETYPGLLNISDFETAYQQILKSNPPPNAVKIDLTSQAVRKVTGIPLDKIETEALAKAAAAAKKTE